MNDRQDDIDMIRRHTSYTDDEVILQKLEERHSAIAVITEFVGSNSKSTNTPSPCRNTNLSINQEIYKLLRHKMQINNKK
jgi:hypothetical protein